MDDLICRKPPIQRTPLSVRVVNALIYSGFCNVPDYTYKKGLIVFGNNFSIDWQAIKVNQHKLSDIWNIGKKGCSLISKWLKTIEAEYPELMGDTEENYISKAAKYIEKCSFGILNAKEKSAIFSFAEWLEASRPTPLAPDTPSAGGNGGENNQSNPANREHK